MNTIVQIPFHGETIPLIIKEDGSRFIQMKPVCEALGLDWSTQLKRVKTDPHLKCGDIPILTNQGVRETTCIPANRFVAWLYTVNPWKVWNPETRRKLELFREEAADVLDAHFTGKPMANRGQMSMVANPAMEGLLKPAVKKVLRYFRLGLTSTEISRVALIPGRTVRRYVQILIEAGYVAPTTEQLAVRQRARNLGKKHLTLVEG